MKENGGSNTALCIKRILERKEGRHKNTFCGTVSTPQILLQMKQPLVGGQHTVFMMGCSGFPGTGSESPV